MIYNNQVAAFLANKNAADQTGIATITWTQLTFGTEIYDIGAHFASSAWVPPAGLVHIGLTCAIGGTLTNAALGGIAIYKGASPLAQIEYSQWSSAAQGIGIAIDDLAGGSDSYTAYVYLTTTTTGTALGAVGNTFFYGHWISP